MAKKKKEKDRWTLLAEAAKELNKVLGLEPAIKTTKISEAELEEKLEEAAALVAPEDEFTDQTAYVLSEFTDVVDVPEGYEESEAEEAETEEAESEVEEEDGETVVTEEAEAEEAEEDEEEYTLEEIREFVETTAKRKDLRIFAGEFPDIFEDSIEEMNDGGLRSAKALKESMLSDLDAEEAEEDWDEEELEETEVETEEVEEAETEDEVEEEKPEKSKKKSSSGKKKPVQSDVIREGITDGRSRDEIIEILNEVFEKGESWAKSRMNTYERAYGEMGESDPKLD